VSAYCSYLVCRADGIKYEGVHEQLGRLSCDTAIAGTDSTLVPLLEMTGSDHMVMGTDYPAAGAECDRVKPVASQEDSAPQRERARRPNSCWRGVRVEGSREDIQTADLQYSWRNSLGLLQQTESPGPLLGKNGSKQSRAAQPTRAIILRRNIDNRRGESSWRGATKTAWC
jgi:hypothetical protein